MEKQTTIGRHGNNGIGLSAITCPFNATIPGTVQAKGA